ncbi:allantoinase AllB [Selenomonas sp. TAMA-11512]|uniref:allantoinase AllB n=1 Tax=Selenomonas sp. TAMA-11512 TaxID=3095337 RepID=UPI003091A302|nr:allantoinase AllB [Selenomonas sp. TAMA-11512]
MAAQYSLLLRGGRVLLPEGEKVVDIAVEGEKIAAIGEELTGTAAREIDAKGKVIFPGTFDAHVHFNDPGRREWETIATGTAALAAGGGTAFVDMPLNSNPCTLHAKELNDKIAIAEKDSVTDFAFWGGLTPQNLDSLEELAEGGCMGFKSFACYSGIPEFEGIDDYTALKGMEKIKKLGLPLMVHCESPLLVQKLGEEMQAEGKEDVWAYFHAHARITELESVQRMISIAEETGVQLIIAHVSLAESLDIIRAAKLRGVDVTAETIGQYLILTDEEVAAIGTAAKCSPPVRDAANQLQMWARLMKGDIDFVDSDHSPSDPSLKEGVSFVKAWGGIASVEHTLTGLLTHGYHARRIPLSLIAKLTSENAARTLHVPNKGKIAVGYDADFAIVDLDETWTLTKESIHYLHPVSPYMGTTFKGQVKETILRGESIQQNGKVAMGGRGKLVRPERVVK